MLALFCSDRLRPGAKCIALVVPGRVLPLSMAVKHKYCIAGTIVKLLLLER